MPKTRNERFVWENKPYLYRFYLLYTTMSKWSECTHIRCVMCVCARSGSSASTLDGGRVEEWCWRNFSSANGGISQSDRLMQIPNPVHANTREVCDGCCNYAGASAPCFRHALRQRWRRRARARAHASPHRMCVHQITWTWLCTRGKKRYKYCFSHTKRSFRVLGHQCVVTMGNCLIWISLCMFFFPLTETVSYTCHYMTDRLERFDLKTSKLDLLKKKRHLHLGCPWGKLIDTKF